MIAANTINIIKKSFILRNLNKLNEIYFSGDFKISIKIFTPKLVIIFTNDVEKHPYTDNFSYPFLLNAPLLKKSF